MIFYFPYNIICGLLYMLLVALLTRSLTRLFDDLFGSLFKSIEFLSKGVGAASEIEAFSGHRCWFLYALLVDRL